jgi:hypothetical protein
MRRVAFLSLIVFLSACTLVQRKVEVLPWPSDLSVFEGEGDLDLRSQKEHFSGSFILRMSYPDNLFLEVYGSFGQTFIHLRKEGRQFLLVAGEERTTNEKLLVDRFHFTVSELMEDLALKGAKQETPEGLVALRKDYRVVYSHDRRGRRNMCWVREDGRLCLAFNELNSASP